MTQPSPPLACQVLSSHVCCHRKSVSSFVLEQVWGPCSSWMVIVSWVHRRGNRVSLGPSPQGWSPGQPRSLSLGCVGQGARQQQGHLWESQLWGTAPLQGGSAGGVGSALCVLRACSLSLLRLLHVVSFLAMDRGTQNRGSPCHWSPACLHSGVTQGVSLEFSVTLPPGWPLTAMVQPCGGSDVKSGQASSSSPMPALTGDHATPGLCPQVDGVEAGRGL